MRLFIFLLFITLLTSCKKTLTIESDSGKISSIEIENKQLLSTEKKIEKKSEPEIKSNVSRSCTDMGLCCKCGLTMSMKHECSCSVWKNCPGTRLVTLKVTKVFFREEYTVNKEGRSVVYKSPIKQEEIEETISSGSCRLQ